MSLFTATCARTIHRGLFLLIRRHLCNVSVLVTCLAIGTSGCIQVAGTGAENRHVKVIADQRLPINTANGAGLLPVYANLPIDRREPTIKRVFIVMHGTLRNADAYFASGRQVVERGGDLGKDVMVVAPQFLTPPDIRAFSLSADTLAWTEAGWKGGEVARQPWPISSFAALDALLAHFANRALYPSLSTVVMMGHSAGAQLLQRYAVAGQEEEKLARVGISVRYIVSNPSSYLYFDDQRPNGKVTENGACPSATVWKYGLESAPPYVASQDPKSLETHYVQRSVVYLLGQADTDPYTHYIDRSCAAMAQGPYRLARGLSYFDYLKKRHPSDLAHMVVEVPGVGHDNLSMFTSDCGLAVLFDKALPQSCPVFTGAAARIRAEPR
ncbi:hypothetical protein [Burkholderia ubonensis]|uniref:hypothetical protein n=1 Tax=Burkholderia ubonensis TaxID=101571 RepID=UPI0009B4375B|nr:hypothetical protein [Burkholderia ubonensis]